MVNNFIEEYELNIKNLTEHVEGIREILPRIEMFEYMREVSNYIVGLSEHEDFRDCEQYNRMIFDLQKHYSFDQIAGKDCDVCFITNITKKFAKKLIIDIEDEINDQINDMDLEEDLN
jgi:hypothetical protein